MSRKKKKKLDDDGEEIKEDLLSYFDTVPTVTILGQKLERIPHEGTADCKGCHTNPTKFHFCACEFEICPWCRGQAVSCLCDPDILNAEKELYVECLEGTEIEE